MAFIEFANDGEVPVNAFKLLGASSKRNDSSKIGYFGTGLKYALAVLLRENIDFKVYSGEKEIKVDKVATDFLGRKVEVITIDGEKTSITLEAGINWETWFAIREIYSNTIDEAGTMNRDSQLNPEAGKTKIYIDNSYKLNDFFRDWSLYFSDTRKVLFQNEKGSEILQKVYHPNYIVFRKGIRAFSDKIVSVFDYNLDYVHINESRVAERSWEVKQHCADLLIECSNVSAIKEFIKADKDTLEMKRDFWDYSIGDYKDNDFDDAWGEALKDYRVVPREYALFYGITKDTILLPGNLCKALFKKFGDDLQISGHAKEQYKLTNTSTNFLKATMDSFERVGYSYDFKKVKMGTFKDAHVMGMFDDQKDLIIISEEMRKSENYDAIPETLFEEIAHAKSGYGDNTREFQTYLIQQICSLVDRKVRA